MSAIAVDRLSRRFGSLEAVRGVSFEVGEGELFGFLGPNGAGKTTTIKMLATLLTPSAGQAWVAGHDVVAEALAVRQAIGIIFQDSSLDDRLTAEENLYIHALLYDLDRAQSAARASAVLEMVDLTDRRKSLVKTFSGGMRRRLEIARGLMHAPRVLFLDEPTVGLDPQTRNAIWQHVHKLRAGGNVTVFMTTHYLEEAENCDRIAIIDHGVIVALGTPEELKRRVGGDVIVVGVNGEQGLREAFASRYGVEVMATEGELRFEVGDGASFVPRLTADFPGAIRSVSVHRPTLDDVFLKLTGRAIRDEEVTGADQMRARVQSWRRHR